MSAKITKHSPPPPDPIEVEHSWVQEFKLNAVKEAHHGIMIIVFFLAAFTIYFKLTTTLIDLVEASRILLSAGLCGFVLSFLLRKKLHLTILDGLYYSTFAVAPILLASFLFINACSSQEYKEVHNVLNVEFGGKGYIYQLENDAYDEFWRIRNLAEAPSSSTSPQIEFTFSDGVFGYRVLREADVIHP
ncbi:MAG: hypothetical protein ACPGD8_04805 [Flavobacteriales bacterium]